jgi:hypothetical protein
MIATIPLKTRDLEVTAKQRLAVWAITDDQHAGY